MKEKNLSAKPRMIACNPIIDHIQGAAAGKSYLATGHGSYSHGRPLFRSFSISNPCTDELGEEDKGPHVFRDTGLHLNLAPLERNAMLGLLQHELDMQPPSLDQKPIDSRPKSDEVVRRGRENTPSQCSSTRHYGAEVTHTILPEKARTTFNKRIPVSETDIGKSSLATGHGSYPHESPISSGLPRYRIHHPCIDELGEEDKD
ncbi:hypothetical protein V6N12_022209 [Hibiscus sabdariffa]|uniref:Uncharacterized protein n=1 Tax=Hibiscus sabdariffa TaxID=183260 RepID=A0ABR2FUT2_9ROSI